MSLKKPYKEANPPFQGKSRVWKSCVWETLVKCVDNSSQIQINIWKIQTKYPKTQKNVFSLVKELLGVLLWFPLESLTTVSTHCHCCNFWMERRKLFEWGKYNIDYLEYIFCFKRFQQFLCFECFLGCLVFANQPTLHSEGVSPELALRSHDHWSLNRANQ